MNIEFAEDWLDGFRVPLNDTGENLHWERFYECLSTSPPAWEEDQAAGDEPPRLAVLPPPQPERACQDLNRHQGPPLAQCRVSMFKNAFGKVPKHIELSEVLEAIRAGQWRQEIIELRQIRARSLAEYKEAKRYLPAFAMSGTGMAKASSL